MRGSAITGLKNLPVKIFHYQAPSSNLGHLRALAECVGISSELVDLDNGASLVGMLKELSYENAGAVLDLASLRHVLDLTQLQEAATWLRNSPVKLLLLATEIDRFTNQILHILTQGAVCGVGAAGKAEHVNFPMAAGTWSRELAGHSYARRPEEALCLLTSRESDTNSIVELDGSPTFARAPLGEAQLFVWSTLEVIDPLRPLSAEVEFEHATDQYIPAIVFLRSAFGERCWHNPCVSGAIVIDDPLLKRKYGFINFPDLLASARRHGYRVTLAFIPWNSWRSRAEEVQVFREYQDCFSICVHGCDHTDDEYGSVDYDSLLGKNIIAAERMEQHRQRTGLPYEAIMVCPQEKYSLQAMRAFADGGQFLGLVNTSCLPRNLTNPQVCAADLLFPAQDSSYGFPVFKRHYWNDMSAFAMDRFLGKPAILVEHHDFFRHSCAGAENFASQLSRLSPAVEWKPVSEIVVATHLQRRVTETVRAVRFFARKFQFAHAGEAVTYRLSKRIPGAMGVQRVLVNGIPVPFSREADMVAFDVRAHGPQRIDVQIESAAAIPAKTYRFRLGYQAQVALRRLLCEFRDNVVSKHRLASRAGQHIVQAMKAARSSHNTRGPKNGLIGPSRRSPINTDTSRVH